MTASTVVNRTVAALLAMVLMGGAVLALIEIFLAAIGRSPLLVPHAQWTDWLQQQTWNSAISYAVLAGLVLAGLLLLVLAVRPGKPGTLSLPAQMHDVRVHASRRSVEKSLVAVTSRVSGVNGARASAGRRAVRVQATTAARAEPELKGKVIDAVDRRLQDLGLERLRSRVRLKARSGK